jgi:MFS family permease
LGPALALALVVLLTVFTHIAFAGARVAVSLFALSLDASPFVVGVLGALFALLPMLFAVSAGRAIDRLGLRRPMLAGAITVTIGSVLAYVWPVLGTLYFTSMLVGSGLMLFHIAVSNATGAIGADRPRNFAFLALGFSISGFLGPVMAGIAIDALGFASAFLLLSVFPLIAVIALATGKVPLPRLPPSGHRAERRLADLLRIEPLRRVLIVSGLFSMAWDMFIFAVPIYGAGLGLSASTIGALLGAFAAATFVVRLVLPVLSRRVREWQLVIAALVISCAIFTVFPLVERVAVLLSLSFILGLGLGMSQPMVMSLLYSAAPSGRAGEAVGIRTSLINFSQAAMPLLFGALGLALGIAPVFWAMALALAGGTAFARRHR